MPLTCPRCGTALPENARSCPHCGQAPGPEPVPEPEFRHWRRRFHVRLTVFCAMAVPVGLLFLGSSPSVAIIVSGLGLAGVLVGLLKLSRLPAGTHRH